VRDIFVKKFQQQRVKQNPYDRALCVKTQSPEKVFEETQDIVAVNAENRCFDNCFKDYHTLKFN
jgi:phospholipase C